MSQERKIRTLKDTNYFAHGTYKRQFRDYFQSIGLTHIITRTVLAPLQRWRIIKQTQIAYPLRPIIFNSFKDYIIRTPKQQGYLSFWRGNMAGIWLYLTQTVIQIGLYDNLRNLQKQLTLQQPADSFYTPLVQRLFIPIISTFFTQIITLPIDTARVRLSMNFVKQIKHGPFTGVRTCWKHLRSQQSFGAMWKGFFLSNIISLINFNLYLSLSQAFASNDLEQQNNSNFYNADTIASVGALLLIHPLDTLKKIVQLNNQSSPSMFRNVRQAFKYIQRQASVKALYNGILASTVRSLAFLPTFYCIQSLIKEKKVEN